MTGLTTVDEPHHHLVDVNNPFGELLMRPQGSSGAEIEAVFGELASYAKFRLPDPHWNPCVTQVLARHKAVGKLNA